MRMTHVLQKHKISEWHLVAMILASCVSMCVCAQVCMFERGTSQSCSTVDDVAHRGGMGPYLVPVLAYFTGADIINVGEGKGWEPHVH